MADSVTMHHPKHPDAGTITIESDRVPSKELLGWVVQGEPKKGSASKAKLLSASADEPSAEER